MNTKKKILVVEDDAAIRDSMKEFLQDHDYEVICAKDGKEGIDYLKSEGNLPNLIILDLMMPRMDGFQFRTAQKEDSRLAEIPVVVMTADSQAEDKKIKIGAKDLLKKPFDIQSMIKVVNQYVHS